MNKNYLKKSLIKNIKNNKNNIYFRFKLFSTINNKR